METTVQLEFCQLRHTLTRDMTKIDCSQYNTFCEIVDKIVELITKHPELVEYDKWFEHPLLCEFAHQVAIWNPEYIGPQCMRYAAEKLNPIIGQHRDKYECDWADRFVRLAIRGSCQWTRDEYYQLCFSDTKMNIIDWVKSFTGKTSTTILGPGYWDRTTISL